MKHSYHKKVKKKKNDDNQAEKCLPQTESNRPIEIHCEYNEIELHKHIMSPTIHLKHNLTAHYQRKTHNLAYMNKKISLLFESERQKQQKITILTWR